MLRLTAIARELLLTVAVLVLTAAVAASVPPAVGPDLPTEREITNHPGPIVLVAPSPRPELPGEVRDPWSGRE